MFGDVDPYRPRGSDPAAWRMVRNLTPIVATETLRRPEVIPQLQGDFLPNLAASFDMEGGNWVGEWSAWRDFAWSECEVNRTSSLEELLTAVSKGVAPYYLILLDRVRVGTYSGPGTEHLLAVARRVHEFDLIVGGGIGGSDDVKRLADAGADAGLVASALHDGRLDGLL